jgi:hypothetical protein
MLRQWALVGSLWTGRIPGKALAAEDGQTIRQVDIQFDPSQAQFSVYFSPIQRFVIGGDRYKRTNEGLRSLMEILTKSKEAQATAKPHHAVFAVRANGDIVVPTLNLADGRKKDGDDIDMALEAEGPRAEPAARALDILGDLSLCVPWIERRLSRPV